MSDEQIQAWADEAEAGYDLQQLPRLTPGRPTVGWGSGTVVTVRLDAELLAASLSSNGPMSLPDIHRSARMHYVKDHHRR